MKPGNTHPDVSVCLPRHRDEGGLLEPTWEHPKPTSNHMKKYANTQTSITFILLCSFLLLVAESGFAAKTDTLQVYSEAMQREIPAAVVIPAGYDETDARFPVLYLLHGGTGSFRDWHTRVPDTGLLRNLADQYNIIIVTPDGGPLSYYFDSPTIKESQYTTFISRELIEEIDGRYRTIPEKRGRVIAGLSMGGHGAFYIATKNPDLYSAAGSMSGVMDINTRTWKVPEEFAQSRHGTFEELLGPPENPENPYREYTAAGLTDQMKENDVQGP
jgi:S-formylglutathione hydrolase FrmB